MCYNAGCSLTIGNSFSANLMASVIGAMWYFATLTEIPILEALRANPKVADRLSYAMQLTDAQWIRPQR